jgi:glycerophosphoryl diester phosphodiesterase
MSRRRITQLALLIVGLAAILLPLAAVQPADAAITCPAFVAHRGEVTPTTTEDGQPAEALGIQDPRYVAVEDDAWPTADGRFLMIHNSTVDATTDGTGAVSTHTLAWWQANIRVDDGSVPMSLPQYLALFSHYKAGHGYLHVKTAKDLPELAAELNAAKVQHYVRVMAGSAATLNRIHQLAPAYALELVASAGGNSKAAHYAAVAKTSGQRRVVLASPHLVWSTATIQTMFDAGLTVEYVTFGADQDAQARQWPFARVFTYNVADLRTSYGSVCA